MVIKVDIKADLTDFDNVNDIYLIRKANKLLNFGVERVLWIVTSLQRVYVIDCHNPTWYIVDWAESITVVDGCQLNIKQLLDEEEIEY
ncbi:hypothetical protein [uncultured Fibrella sp.]|uniref:hypothetical protein n=1 Tax=uncultured Fibrella sp. TaxID=1284596 RepID=UPI0035CC877A